MNDVVKKAIGRVVAIAALCLFSFAASAQVFVSAPGYVVFQYGRDTVDTSALPAFFAVLGDDAKKADNRTAEMIETFNNGVDAVDCKMQSTLQGIGLKHYVWFRGFLIAIEDTRNDHHARQRK